MVFLDVLPEAAGEVDANLAGLGLIALAMILICGAFCFVDALVEQRHRRRVEGRILRGEMGDSE